MPKTLIALLGCGLTFAVAFTGRSSDALVRRLSDSEFVFHSVESLAFSTDGRLLAAGIRDTGTVIIWDVESGKSIGKVEAYEGDDVISVQFIGMSDRILCTSKNGVANVYDVAERRRLWTVNEEHVEGSDRDNIHFVVANTVPNTLLTCDQLGQMEWRDSRYGEILRRVEFAKGFTAAFTCSPDGKTIAAGAGEAVVMIDSATGVTSKVLASHEGVVTAIAFSPDGEILVSGDVNGKMIVRSAKKLLHKYKIDQLKSVHAIAFSPNSQHFASIGRDGLHLWSIENGKMIASIPETSGLSIAFSPTSSVLAAAKRAPTQNGVMVELWDWEKLATLTNAE